MADNRRSAWCVWIWSVLVVAMATVGAPQASSAQGPVVWNLKTVDDGGQNGDLKYETSIAHDANNNIHISYYDSATGTLKYATNASGTFRTFTADPTVNRGEYSSIAVGPGGTVHISYFDAQIGALRYVKGTATGVFSSPQVVDDGLADPVSGLADEGSNTSIALDAQGNVHISYHDSSTGNLLHAAFPSAGPFPVVPSIAIVDGVSNKATQNVGHYNSLAIDGNGSVHISYYDFGNGVLKYANNVGGTFSAITVDDGGGGHDVGWFSSLALDSNGRVHISYHDATDFTLKYANNELAPGTFVVATIDEDHDGGNVGRYSSIAVDSRSKVHISYQDFGNGVLKHITNASGSFVSSVVDNYRCPDNVTPDTGYDTHITIDSGDHVHISYIDNGSPSGGDLRHANSVVNRVVDFNGDGKSDVAWYYTLNGTLVSWFMDGTAVSSVSVAGQVSDLTWRIEALADFNNDSRTDVLWKNSLTGAVAIWFMNGSAIQSVNIVGAVSDLNYSIEGAGDFNGDGNADIVWKHASTGQVVVWLMNGPVLSSINILGSVPRVWSIEKIGDVDGDGRADILWKHTSLGIVAVWRMNGAAVLSVSTLGTISDLSWVIQEVGDFNADGTADILWKHAVTGTVAIWTMSRGTGGVSAATVAGTVSDLNWMIEGVGDLNADNKADIIWKNAATGQTVLWLMNGPTVYSVVSPATVADLNWRVVN